MISVVISSYQPKYFTALEKNIAETVGIPYEIIKIDNPGLMGICEAYNKGAEKAKFENLLFLHEDVSFETLNWGEKLLAIIEKPETGVVGVAGSSYVPNCPYAWWDLPLLDYRHMNQFRGNEKIKEFRLKEERQVSSLDGVFLSCRKTIWNKNKFNEKIKGFHGYDIDFSVRVANNYTNVVCNSLVINHYSTGKTDRAWFAALIRQRPLFHAPERQKINKKNEAYFYKVLEDYLLLLDFSDKERKRILLKYNLPKYIGYKQCIRNLQKFF
ncbi:glycosyltransferase [Chryseobacterium taklimakanense]|uniref:glycosyltransferase n=1 Tax=Chryseobacterium taklimakanense TaxID=536441 RepID=UPI0023F89DAF|nr:glycosyltransferase [Chryseobacterium taklimakanense]